MNGICVLPSVQKIAPKGRERGGRGSSDIRGTAQVEKRGTGYVSRRAILI